jgi:hypothetical protein
MASGMGVRGTTGRCFGFFSDFKACKVCNSLALSGISRVRILTSSF